MRPARRHAGLLLIVLTMVPLVYLSFQELGPLAGALSVVALACAAALALRVRERPDREVAANVAHIGLALLPGALTVYFAFQAGGFFPDGPAAGAVAVLAILILHTTLSERPFEGVSIPLIVAAASLAALAAWTLLSGLWSEAPARALIEFGRVMPYLLGLVLFGATPRTPERMSWIVRGLAAGCVTVCVVALVTRLLPDVWTVTPSLANIRLSYPLTYWNALGLLAVLGGVFSFHLAASDTESGVVRVLGAAAMPLVATTVLFTFSRGAILVALVALPLYAILVRQRAFLGAAIATLPAVAVAVSAAYAANPLATP